MPKEWILNRSNDRWGLTRKNRVGPVVELIRKLAPKTRQEWEDFYYAKVYPEQHLVELGKKLYVKVSEVLVAEIEEVTEPDCIEWIKNLVIKRTFEGYETEKRTIYGQLQPLLGVQIKPAPDEWDRLYNVDFYIEVNGRYIGLQIKPETFEHAPEAHNLWLRQQETHQRFNERFGGRVFLIISITRQRGQKEIYNKSVVDEIKSEIERLRGEETQKGS